MASYLLAGALLALITLIPLAWKWQLGIRRTIFVVMIFATLSSVVVAASTNSYGFSRWVSLALVWTLTSGSAFLLLAYLFYRDPERVPPERNDVVVSPADGEVIYVRTSEAGVLPISNKQGRKFRLIELTRTKLNSEDNIVIGIGMNFTDVHVNRAPIKGKVISCRHFPGRFGSLRKVDMVFENERATTLIEGNGLQAAVVQIASRLVRQIVVFVSEGADVALGQRIGVIRLGSQVDLVLPSRDIRVTVQVGQRLRAGESIVAIVGCRDMPTPKSSNLKLEEVDY